MNPNKRIEYRMGESDPVLWTLNSSTTWSSRQASNRFEFTHHSQNLVYRWMIIVG